MEAQSAVTWTHWQGKKTRKLPLSGLDVIVLVFLFVLSVA